MKRRILIWALVLLALPILPAVAVQVTWTWTPPTTGAPVDHYDFALSMGDTLHFSTVAVPKSTSLLYDTPAGPTWARVRGVTLLGTAGKWSPISLPYEEQPGACGRPGYAR